MKIGRIETFILGTGGSKDLLLAVTGREQLRPERASRYTDWPVASLFRVTSRPA
jgi:hypothetical protein